MFSVWPFGERFTNSPAKVAIAVVAFGVRTVGVVMLTRTAPQVPGRSGGVLARPFGR